MDEPTCEKGAWSDSLSDAGYSQADYLRVRNTLVQILEEVKLRRNTDLENEARIKYLVREKHQLECKYDSEVSRVASLGQKHTEEVWQIHREYEERIRQMREEKTRHKLCKKNVEKETKALKDEVQNLQLDKYSLEKQLHEQSGKLQLQMSAADKYLAQLSALEQKFNSVAKQYHLVLGSQGRLEKNVEESMHLNRTLSYVNQHQKCLVAQYCRDLEVNKQALLAARVQIQSQPAETSQALKQLELNVKDLQAKVTQKTEELEQKNQELESKDTLHQKTLEELRQCHKLVESHLKVSQQHRDTSKDLTDRMAGLETERETLQTRLEETTQELETQEMAFEQARQDWKTQEEDLKGRLSRAETELREVSEGRDKLEGLNSAWAQENLKLTHQLQQLQKIVNVEKVEGWSQVELDMTSRMQQTDTLELVTSETQVPSTLTCMTATQTGLVKTSVSGSQTDDISKSCISTQDHLCCPELVNSITGTSRSMLKGGNTDGNLCSIDSMKTCDSSTQSPLRDNGSKDKPCSIDSTKTCHSANQSHCKDSTAKDTLCHSQPGETCQPANLSGNCAPVGVSRPGNHTSSLERHVGSNDKPGRSTSTGRPLFTSVTALSTSSFGSPNSAQVLTDSGKDGFSPRSDRALYGNHPVKALENRVTGTGLHVDAVTSRPKYVFSSNSSISSIINRTVSASSPSQNLQSTLVSSLTSSSGSVYGPVTRPYRLTTSVTSAVPKTLPQSAKHSQISCPKDGSQDLRCTAFSSITGSSSLPHNLTAFSRLLTCSALQGSQSSLQVPVTCPGTGTTADTSTSVTSKNMGSVVSTTTGSTGLPRSCQLRTKVSVQSCPPLDVKQQDSETLTEQTQKAEQCVAVKSPGFSPTNTEASTGESVKGSQQPVSQPQPAATTQNPAAPSDSPSAQTNLKGILKDGPSLEKKTVKSVHFAGLRSLRPPKRPTHQTDGDTPLFSDTEEDEIELGSQMSSIQAILSPEVPRVGSKRKHQQT